MNTCPFSNESKNETELAKEFFPDIKRTDSKIGRFEKNFAGYVKEDDFRKKGSSGGVAKWIGYQLLKNNEIDYFVQLIPNQSTDSSELLFDYGFFSKPEDVLKGSKSSYYPVTLVDVINKIANEDARFAITGVPCFIKTLRLIASEDKILKERIKFTLGIVCGGMKSANHAKMIGWELGVNPENLIGIDFRRKYKDRPASQKIYQVWSNKDNVERYRNAGEIFGTDYGSGLFKPKACDYCDDVVGELADVSIGDAWLKDYRNDPDGTSLIIVRNQKILALLENAAEEHRVKITEITEVEAGDSQAGGFRHRREGLSYRLKKRHDKGEWVPKKRVEPGEFDISSKRKRIYDLREKLAEDSHIFFHEALVKNDPSLFKSKIGVLMNKYYKANLPPVYKRIKNKAQRALKKLKLK
ncbi:coenzyme F420-dependent oxidoreductase [Jejuia pallidilutea]|uniref:Coenzyme F420-dependent oxidoreductase n=1 Tax=Jejuia pallidilutea TaxID=504487 RepID=A0A090VW78_9FLAO|nr:coenzyme F420-dependent oxidoreductase [Jejuia pallidilutea]